MDRLVGYIRSPDISPARWGFIGGVFFYMVALHLSYVYLISPVFGYLGLVYRPAGTLHLIAAGSFALLPALWMPLRMKRPSQVIYLLLYLWAAVPFLLVAAFTSILPLNRIVLFGFLLSIVLAGIRVIYQLPLLQIPKLIETKRGFWLTFVSISGLLYGVLLSNYGLYTDIPSLGEIYTQRADFRRTVTGINEYFYHWIAKAINPFLIAKGFVDRNAAVFSIGVGGQVLLFAMSGLKAVLLSSLLLAAILIALQGGGENFSNWVVWGLVTLIGATAALDYYLELKIFTSLFVRRLLFVPGLNMSYFLDFFSTNPNTLFGHSIFGVFVEYPYEVRPAMLIGDVYAGAGADIDISANANLWADGYASFGIPGIIFFSAVLAALLWLADSLAKGCPLRIAVLVLALPSYHLVDTKLQTSILTHGVGLVLVILYLLPRQTSTTDDE